MFQNKPDNMKGLLTEEVNVRIYICIYESFSKKVGFFKRDFFKNKVLTN